MIAYMPSIHMGDLPVCIVQSFFGSMFASKDVHLEMGCDFETCDILLEGQVTRQLLMKKEFTKRRIQRDLL